jgi:hypothetical protein
MTTNNKEDYHAYLSSPCFGVMSFQQWLAAKAFMEGMLPLEVALQTNREMK